MINEYEFKNHDEWLSIRSKYIGGSDAGAVIGLNPYKSAYALWAEKTGRIDGFEGNMATKVGTYLEEFVAKLFEEETGKRVRRKNRTMVNDLYPFACANVDRLVVGEKALLEIKTTTSIPIMKQLRGTEFPEAYYSQVTHYLAVTGLPKAYLAVLINCRELKIYELERDQGEIDALMKAEAEFWECVKNDTPPEVDGSDATTDTLVAMYPNSSGREVDLFGFGVELEEYMRLGEEIKTLTTMRDERANIIREYMRDASAGVSDHYKVTYNTSTSKRFDEKKFAADHKDMDLSKYYTESSTRRFLVKKKGEK